MSMRTECRDAIYNYADEETQRDAALTGENKDYVNLVLILLRDQYHIQVAAGETTFSVPDDTAVFLTEECPW